MLAIIGLLAGIIFPVVAVTKSRAKMATCISNLRQCGTALVIYEEGGDEVLALPPYPVAETVLARAPTCDPSDFLRTGCSSPFARPVIGSYGYVRGFSELDDSTTWSQEASSGSVHYVLASVFYGDRPVHLFDGNELDPCLADGSCSMPSRLIRSRPDTSVSNQATPGRVAYGNGSVFSPFTWSGVFAQP